MEADTEETKQSKASKKHNTANGSDQETAPKKQKTADKTKTSNKSAQKQAGTVTPEKKKDKKKYWVLEFKNGTHKTFSNRAQITVYQHEFGDDDGNIREFKTAAEYHSYVGLKNVQIKEEPEESVVMTDKDVEEAAKINEYRKKNAPMNRIEIYTKTNKMTKAVLVIIYHKDKSGQLMWLHKASHLASNMNAYVSIKSTGLPTVDYILKHLDTIPLRDNSGDVNAIAFKQSKGGNKQKFDEYIPYSHFLLPLEELSNQEEEDQYIADVCTQLGEQLKSIQQSPVYYQILGDTVKEYSETLWEKMTKPGRGPTFLQYINSCTIKISKAENLNRHTTANKTTGLIEILRKHSTQNLKYTNESDNDSEESLEEEDNEEKGDDNFKHISNEPLP